MTKQKYSKYKISHNDWIGDIPGHWEVWRNRFVMTYRKGRNPSILLDDQQGSNTLPYLSMDLLRSKEDAQVSYAKLDDGLVETQEKDLLLLRDGSNAGEFIKSNKRGILSSTMAKFNISKDFESGYAYYLSKYFEPVIQALSIGMGIPHVNTQILKNLPYLKFDYSEQQAIAKYLDDKTTKIDEAISLKEKHIELLKERRIALINQAVTKGLDPGVEMVESGIEWIGRMPKGWEVRKLKTLALVKRGASPRPIDDMKYFDENGEYARVRIEDVTASSRYLEQSKEKLSELGKSCSVPLEPGEMFLSIAGSVGKQIITKIKCCIHDGFVALKNLKIEKELLYYIFEGGELYKGEGKLGTQLNLNSTSVGNLYIPFPPSNKEQQDIFHYLDRETAFIDQTISVVQHSIDLLIEYKQSLISHVVTGKIKML